MSRDCNCLVEGPRYPDLKSTYIGEDPSNGRYADVTAIECSRCRRLWLKYGFEDEATSRSGRWYEGLVTPDQVEDLAPLDAPALLESLPWHLRGGSYFGGKVIRSSGPLVGF
jgi:hypothetical protein